jgi:N-acetylmuramoyl-L-alanine amidase
VRLYLLGDDGEPIRDIQDRLAALGFASPDRPGHYDAGTHQAVISFQEAHGLPSDGIVGPSTWRTLVDAGFRLGDRMLYHRIPMIRGDDVAELQRRLNSLGFDAGKVDGIFGPDTLRAMLDFQSNRRMAEDGIAGREVVAELDLMSRATNKPGREAVRERQWLAALPPTIAGQRIYVDASCRDPEEADASWSAAVEFGQTIQNLGGVPVYSRSADAYPSERVRALRANRLGTDFVVSFAEARDGVPAVCFFSSHHSHSAAGEKLAAAVASKLGLEVLGRTVPMLRDTRAPAVVVAVTPVTSVVARNVASAIVELLAAPREDPPRGEPIRDDQS